MPWTSELPAARPSSVLEPRARPACARAWRKRAATTINGRDGKALEQTAAELRQATGARPAVQADVATPEGQAALLSACPERTSW
jgi:hypothetical protein